MIKNILFMCIAIVNVYGTQQNDGKWNGNWFPHSPSQPDLNPEVKMTKKSHLSDPEHGIVMGVKDGACDDGKFNLQVDWYKNPENYTCLSDRHLYLPNSAVHPIHTMEHIPKSYKALHQCMNLSIEYSEVIPTFGIHRPLWAVYGEYKFLPKQRWLHNLEHGAVAMLYHPCAERSQVNALKTLVKSCLRKHVITPYNGLSAERPLALVTWGQRLEMSKVSKEVVVDFIKKHALKGPEDTSWDGQYDLMLEHEAQIVSSIDDSELCPGQGKINME